MEQMPHNLYQYSIPAQPLPRMQPRVYLLQPARPVVASMAMVQSMVEKESKEARCQVRPMSFPIVSPPIFLFLVFVLCSLARPVVANVLHELAPLAKFY
eukprot:scaffold94955_cov34-Attheya_sp.AAC.2